MNWIVRYIQGVITMAEPEKQKMGDGSDNYGQAARQEAAKQATANAATATLKAGVEGGKAVSDVVDDAYDHGL